MYKKAKTSVLPLQESLYDPSNFLLLKKPARQTNRRADYNQAYISDTLYDLLITLSIYYM